VGVNEIKKVNAPSCGRENDLVAFLYGELSDREKESFDSHLHACSSCQVQTTELGLIRESVSAWRNESLGRVSVTVPETSSLINQRKGSEAALRSFFDLSALWMKGAIGFTAILFCVLTIFTADRLRNTPEAVTVKNTTNQGYSQEQLNALVEKRVQQELASRRVAEQPSPKSQASVVGKNRDSQPQPRSALKQVNQIAASARVDKARRPLSKAEREQLAADLRLVSAMSERGFDLVEDQINQ
jgi:anti-sigma factor RsiW